MNVSANDNLSRRARDATEGEVLGAGSRSLDVESGHSMRLIAFYLPQYHPIPENDLWWGKGFTEWTNVAKAKPLFPGHYQPHIPADLGFYDLRVPETRAAQAEMAREYGIEGFCYYHYWFAGKRLLERPFDEVLRTGEPDFPFCLCWANQTWTGVWHGCPDRILIEQTYPGPADDRLHFYALLDAFSDPRYVMVDGKPLFLLFDPSAMPGLKRMIALWRELAVQSGLKGLYLVGAGAEGDYRNPGELGLDAATPSNFVLSRALKGERDLIPSLRAYGRKLLRRPVRVFSYGDVVARSTAPEFSRIDVHPTVVPNWDNTPRSGLNGTVLHESTPELFRNHLLVAADSVMLKPSDHRIIFVKAWNEWAEGNHLEPDLRYGRAYLEAIREATLGTQMTASRESR